ncbi:damage-control phosphatase At2g17340-like [Primulina huaijiensis]|uniref:damage-control phosphatase At2g17340-like n=1 Tax=Primulina huaijiensis TaxID=1492673 RepID=UPI003CC7478B
MFAGYIFVLGSAQLADLFSKHVCPFKLAVRTLSQDPGLLMIWASLYQNGVKNCGIRYYFGIAICKRAITTWGNTFLFLQVVLAANDLPSINDIIYTELIEVLAKLKDENRKLLGVDTSNFSLPILVVDLTSVSQKLSYLESDADLGFWKGCNSGEAPRGREFLGRRLYDCIVKFNQYKA